VSPHSELSGAVVAVVAAGVPSSTGSVVVVAEATKAELAIHKNFMVARQLT